MPPSYPMEKNKLEEGQIVMCTVEKIVGTTVFVKIEEFNQEGHISFPEIAPGRIRNIRDYAFPGKRIICKVLNITPESVELSLRRVKLNEKNEFNEQNKKEKSLNAMIKTLLADKADAIITKIKQEQGSLAELIEQAKTNEAILEKYFPKEQVKRISTILNEKKVKEVILTKKFNLSNKSPKGVVLIKNLIQESLKKAETAEVSYIAAGKYLIKLKSKDPKHADQQIREILENLESLAKKNNCEFKEEKD